MSEQDKKSYYITYDVYNEDTLVLLGKGCRQCLIDCNDLGDVIIDNNPDMSLHDFIHDMITTEISEDYKKNNIYLHISNISRL